ncbi:hypothetical protein SLS58_006256 [Diplodia intermedia]|uniref:Uncharacterized protein n=1 Tax=Diplodia intermedia TaxID=856260 RepID=A0ABR3TNU4_9PEZI
MSCLPDLPHREPDTALIVCLCLPTATDGREKLDEALEGCLHPKTRNTSDPKVVSVVDCTRQRKLEKEKAEGSTSELFLAACKAREKGWTKIAVVDNLTYRHLCGQKRPGEKPECSMIILQTSPPPASSKTDPGDELLQPEVAAKRFPLDQAVRMILTQQGDEEPITVNRTAAAFEEDRGRTFYRPGGLYGGVGFALHDWSLPLFSSAAAVRAQRARDQSVARALAGAAPGRAGLPLELADAVREELARPEPVEALTAAPTFVLNNPDVLEFHALVPLRDVEASTAALNERLRAANDKGVKDDEQDVATKAVIYPWKRDGVPASRREFWRLWQRILHHNERPGRTVALFLDVDPAADRDGDDDDDDDDDIPVILAEWQDRGNPTLVSRAGLRAEGNNNLMRLWPAVLGSRTRGYPYCSRAELIEKRKEKGPASPVFPPTDRVECLLGPDARFFVDPPRWKFADEGALNDAHPCFFLTKGEGDGGLKGIVESMHREVYDGADVSEDDGPYAFVEWEGERDGDMDDALGLAVECFECAGSLTRGREEYCIFVDREALRTREVMYSMYLRPLAQEDEIKSREIEKDESLDEETKRQKRFEMYREGIVVARAKIEEEELHLAWCNLTVGNASFEELFDLSQAQTIERTWESEEEKRLAFERWDRSNWRRYV